jgi:hypothetical protein
LSHPRPKRKNADATEEKGYDARNSLFAIKRYIAINTNGFLHAFKGGANTSDKAEII